MLVHVLYSVLVGVDPLSQDWTGTKQVVYGTTGPDGLNVSPRADGLDRMFHVVPRQNIRMLVVFVRWQPTDVPTTSRRTLPSWRRAAAWFFLTDNRPADRCGIYRKLAVSR